MRKIFFLLLAAAGLVASARGATVLPEAELVLSATNVMVTESMHAEVRLWMPPLDAPHGEHPPYLNDRPPHIEADFLRRDWKSGPLKPGELTALRPGRVPRGACAFTLNDYATDAFSAMRDPFSLLNSNPFESLGPRRVNFPFQTRREKRHGVNGWLFTLVTPDYRALDTGRVEFAPVAIRVERIASVDNRGRATLASRTLRTRAATLVIGEPPAEGRPAAWCGALASNLTATAALDASVCTAGDPLLVTLDVSGDADFSRVHAPALKLPSASPFRLDAASCRSSSCAGGKRFTWRVRALKAGTVEFPALEVGWFDIVARRYRVATTAAIPVQVRAGTQAALGAVDEADDDAFPLPDGLDLDFPDGGTADFSLQRAIALACRAATTNDFTSAARAYAQWLEAPPEDPALTARHLANLGALWFFAGDVRAAERAYVQAEDAVGTTPTIRRGLKACWAKRANDPRAEGPLQRVIFPFWYRYPLKVRLAGAFVGALALVLAFLAANAAGRRLGVMLLACTLVTASAHAQGFFRRVLGGGSGAADVKLALHLEPARVTPGQPCALVFDFDMPREAGVENLRFGNLPDAPEIEFGTEIENLADGATTDAKRVVRRFRLPLRFDAAWRGAIAPFVQGQYVTRSGSAGFSFSSSSSFQKAFPSLEVRVEPLPEEGRPVEFRGAIGERFRLTRRLEPQRVHPGDLVTATYVLEHDGHAPTNAPPTVADFGEAFKTYPIKETVRRNGRVEWRQVLVPRTVAASNVAACAYAYYDPLRKRYARVEVPQGHLAFISAEAATTKSETVLMNAGEAAPAANAGATALVLHLAPAATSPVIATLPAFTPVTERERRRGWRRIETPRAIGWTPTTP